MAASCERGGALWVVEKNKLWLVDPKKSGSVLNARRVWRLRSPVRGSAVVATANRIGLVPFQTSGAAHVHWFNIKRLMRRGVLDLAVRSQGRKQLGAVSRTRIPTYVQGATMAGGRLFVARSNLACGELVTPNGRRIALVPGAEGIQFRSGNRRLWAVSESGAPPYARSRKPLTPAAASFGWARLIGGKSSKCQLPRALTGSLAHKQPVGRYALGLLVGNLEPDLGPSLRRLLGARRDLRAQR